MAKKRRQKQQQQRNEAAAVPHQPSSEDVNDSDDEEIDEDEAFNSDDERKYGMFFSSAKDYDDTKPSAKKKSSSNGDDDGDESGSDGDDNDDDFDDDEDGDGGQYMLDLLDKLCEDSNNKKSKNNDNSFPQMVAHVKESAYSSSVVPSAGLTMDALMQDLKDTKGFGALAKTMKVVVSSSKSSSANSGAGATLAPLPRVQSDRLQRQIGYANASEKMSREWMETVQENRKAETLDFRGHLQQETRNKITAATMVQTFTPTTDFEKEIHDALQKAGHLEEESILQAEHEAILRQQHAEDDLGGAELTVEDLAKRRAQLAKMRALMFYHEQKRHYMNKIKSKKYRRIRKRQVERLKQADLDAQVALGNSDLEHELQEKEHVERMKERMTLAHKNTSKWAKRILKRSKKGGASVDVDTRRALSAQLKRGDDLLQKMKSRDDNDGDSSNDDDDDDEDLVETARKVLAEAENEQDDDDADTSSRPGLFKLAFMQRGIEKQKQQAREEARQLLEELKADRDLEQDNGSDDDDDDDNSRDDSNRNKDKPKAAKKKAAPPPVASRQELKDILKEGGEMTTSRSASSAIAVSGNIQIDMGDDNDADNEEEEKGENTAANKEEPSSLRSEYKSMLETIGAVSSNSSLAPKKSAKVPKAKQASGNQQQEHHNHAQKATNENDNPWLAAVAGNDSNKKKSDKSKKSSNSKNMVDVDRAADLLEPHSSIAESITESKKRKSSSRNDDENDAEEQQPQEATRITHLSQEELVRRAFASSTQDAEDDFAQEKAIVEEREDPLYKKKLADQKGATCKGWGSWAGKGAAIAPPPPLGKKSLPPHLQPPAKKKQKKNDDNMDPDKRKRRDGGKEHLIIRERRVKRMADQYMLHQVPYPYACRQDYERAMTGGIGPEWNVTQSVKDLTRPEICTRAGKIIEPLSQQAKKMSKKRKNPTSAKF